MSGIEDDELWISRRCGWYTSVRGRKYPFFPQFHFWAANRFRKSVLRSLEWLISIRCYKWGLTEIGCFSEVVKDFTHWRACLAVWGLRLAVIEVMTSSFPSLGGQIKGSESLERCIQEEQTQTSVHNICMVTWLQLKWRRCGEVWAIIRDPQHSLFEINEKKSVNSILCIQGLWDMLMISDSLSKQMSNWCAGLTDRPAEWWAGYWYVNVHLDDGGGGLRGGARGGQQLRWGLSLRQAAKPDFTLPLWMSPQHISSAFLPFISTPWQANSSEQERGANPPYQRQW